MLNHLGKNDLKMSPPPTLGMKRISFLKLFWKNVFFFQVWKEAATQIFFSLALASGGLINMASYNKLKNNCHSDALIIAFLNCFTSVFAGFVVFAFLGFMAHEKFGEVNEETMKNVAQAGPGLAFVAYPEGIAKAPISPPLLSFLFFSMLLMLGLDSMLGTIETITSAIVDHFTHLRSRLWTVVIGTCTLGLLFGLTLCTSGGIDVLGKGTRLFSCSTSPTLMPALT